VEVLTHLTCSQKAWHLILGRRVAFLRLWFSQYWQLHQTTTGSSHISDSTVNNLPWKTKGQTATNSPEPYEKQISSTFFRTSGLGRAANRSPRNAGFTYFTEIRYDGVDWIHVAQDRSMWQALANRVMNLRVPQNAGNFVTSWETAIP